MREQYTLGVVALYLLVAVFTFGRAFNHAPRATGVYVTQAEISGVAGTVGALLWPLYWSAVLWEDKRGAK